jgi:hypothetical protein
MESPEAKSIGGRTVIKNLTIVLLIVVVINFFMQVRGDFANGILFFIQELTDIYFWILIGAMYLCAYVFGRIAGYSILVKQKNYLGTGAMYGGITAAISLYSLQTVSLYSKIGEAFAGDMRKIATGDMGKLATSDITDFYKLDLPAGLVILLLLIIASVWFLSVWQMKTKYLDPAK